MSTLKHKKYHLKNPYEAGYCLHRHMSIDAVNRVFSDYIKAGIPAIICPGSNGSFPSIWGVFRKAYNRPVLEIYKKHEKFIKESDALEFEKRRRTNDKKQQENVS